MADADTARRFALSMPNVEERTSYGTPAFFVGRALFARFLKDDDQIVIKIDQRARDRLMKADPNAFFITDHYLNYPMMIVRLSAVEEDELLDLLQDAWSYVAD